MNKKLLLALAGSALTVFALAGCSATPSASPAASSGSSATTPPASAPADASVVANDSLGKIIVDGKGMTAYFFDKDTANETASACTAECVALWPAITTTSDAPVVEGITGTVGTITGVEGGKQITVNGLPIYTFAKDTAPGDTNGQGVKDVWHAVSAAGEKILTAK